MPTAPHASALSLQRVEPGVEPRREVRLEGDVRMDEESRRRPVEPEEDVVEVRQVGRDRVADVVEHEANRWLALERVETGKNVRLRERPGRARRRRPTSRSSTTTMLGTSRARRRRTSARRDTLGRLSANPERPAPVASRARLVVTAIWLVAALGVIVLGYPDTFRDANETARANAALDVVDRELGGGNSVVPDQGLMLEARGWIPPTGRSGSPSVSGSPVGPT